VLLSNNGLPPISLSPSAVNHKGLEFSMSVPSAMGQNLERSAPGCQGMKNAPQDAA
jgi:hypothetical protein